MKKLVLFFFLLILYIFPVLSFSTNSSNYKLHISYQGAKYNYNDSLNYIELSTVNYLTVGTNESFNYRLCIGYYCFIDKPEEIIVEELIKGGGYGSTPGLICNSTQIYVMTPSGPSCISYIVYKQYRNRGIILLLCIILSFLFFIYLKRKKEDEQHENKRKF
jgi:hypothetical protein